MANSQGGRKFIFFSSLYFVLFLIVKEEDETLAIFQSLISSGKIFPSQKPSSLLWIPVAFICASMEL